MTKRFRVVAGAAAVLILILMAMPRAALAQTAPTGTPCAAGQKEQITTQPFVSTAFFTDTFSGFVGFVPTIVTANTTVTTYTNYKNVPGLLSITTASPNGTPTEPDSFPAY